jgi:hypothetical protein
MTLFSNMKRISQDRRLRRSATEFDSLVCLTHIETHGLLELVRCLLFNLEIWTAIVWRYGLSQQFGTEIVTHRNKALSMHRTNDVFGVQDSVTQ